jgi:hypothetical protein
MVLVGYVLHTHIPEKVHTGMVVSVSAHTAPSEKLDGFL